ncbi:MAG: hypothetical protein K6E62_12725 [Lachnospiraceae bacterium]|nr:hypothetical protein [Lachnospiraceae bacterium]
MKLNFEREYFKYNGGYRIIITLVLLAAVCGLSALFIGKYWQLGIVAGPILSMGVLCFMDFFIFRGTPLRRGAAGTAAAKTDIDPAAATVETAEKADDGLSTATADAAESTEKTDTVLSEVTADAAESAEEKPAAGTAADSGDPVLIKALRQDLINKALFNLIVMAFILVIVLFFTKLTYSRLFIALCAGAAFAASQAVIRITVIISRRLGTTFQRHTLIVYVAFFICALAVLPLVFLFRTDSKLIALLAAAALEAVSVVTAILLMHTGKKSVSARS